MKTVTRKAGQRPRTNKVETVTALCELIAAGSSLRAACAQLGEDSGAVCRWLREDTPDAELMRQRYARARAAQADLFVDQVIEIADAATDANIARLQIDARKWVAGKMAPKKYGERSAVELTGPDGGPITLAAVKTMPDEELNRRLALLEAKTNEC